MSQVLRQNPFSPSGPIVRTADSFRLGAAIERHRYDDGDGGRIQVEDFETTP